MDMSSTFQRHRVTTSSGVPVAYAKYSPEEQRKDDIVLVHGLASSGLQFHEDALRLAGIGHRVIVPDLRGHGASGVPDGSINVADFSIPIMAADVLAVLDHAKVDRVHWVGNSLGGILALWLLGRADEYRLRSLALFGTCFSMNLPPLVGSVLRLSFLPGAPITAWLTARSTTDSDIGRRSIEAAIRQFNVDAGAAIASQVRNYDFVDNARNYDRPLLLLWGGKDHAVNLGLRRDIDKFANRPNFSRVDLPLGGHCANFDMPDAFHAALAEHWRKAETEEQHLLDFVSR